MSQQAFADFYEKHLNSPEGEAVRAKLDAIEDPDGFCAAMVEAGSAAGFDLSDDDVRQVMRASEMQLAKALEEASGELSDEEVDSVVGGATLSLDERYIPTVNISTSFSSFDVNSTSTSSKTAMCPW